MSQLDLALEAEISPRHLSFIETGRSEPSREMVLRLAETLDLPLRERNSLLEAAGYARMYRETEIGDPEMAQIRRILDFTLARYEPYPAVVIDGHHNLLMANEAAGRFVATFFAKPEAWSDRPLNTVEVCFDPAGLRPSLVNWEDLARALLNRVYREGVERERDTEKHDLLERILSYPGVPARWAAPDLSTPPQLLVPMHLRRGDVELRLFTTITTVGTPQDITLEEIRIETFLPADEASERRIEKLGSGS